MKVTKVLQTPEGAYEFNAEVRTPDVEFICNVGRNNLPEGTVSTFLQTFNYGLCILVSRGAMTVDQIIAIENQMQEPELINPVQDEPTSV